MWINRIRLRFAQAGLCALLLLIHPLRAIAADDVTTQLGVLRDAFVASVHTASEKCQLAPPTIVTVDTPSFGSFDAASNTLRTPLWRQLSPQEQGVFVRAAGPDASPAQAQAEFEIGAHHWIFVHELGHWWQACRHLTGTLPHYTAEFDANRIATAYWREHDPALLTHQGQLFRRIVKMAPSPVPSGAVLESYFNENYEQLGPTPAYIWFQ